MAASRFFLHNFRSGEASIARWDMYPVLGCTPGAHRSSTVKVTLLFRRTLHSAENVFHHTHNTSALIFAACSSNRFVASGTSAVDASVSAPPSPDMLRIPRNPRGRRAATAKDGEEDDE